MEEKSHPCEAPGKTPKAGKSQNRINYQKQLDRLIEANEAAGRRPRLLLHACCAPCSSYCLEYLAKHFQITLFYYNPNITPEAEYGKRVRELKRFLEEAGYGEKVDLIEGKYEPDVYFAAVRGMEDLPERSARCYRCYRLRMEEAARMAVETGADYFTTTLSISPHKNAVWINEIGEALAEKYGVSHLPSDFKKKSGYLRSIELSRQYGLYRQNYCGCIFSQRDAQAVGKTVV